MTRAAPSPPRGERPTASALYRRLITIYIRASAIAVFGGAALYGFGLDLSARQIVIGLGLIAPVALVPMVVFDVLAIRACFQPIGAFLGAAPGQAAPPLARSALIRAMNLPILTGLRVMLIHVPTAAVSITILMLILNRYMVLGIQPGQFAVLWPLTVLVGTGHAIIEYFLVAEAIRPVIRSFWARGADLRSDVRRQIIPVDMRRTLLFVSVFMVFVPLLALGFTVMVKVNNVLGGLGVQDVAGRTAPLYWWIALLTTGCMAVVLFMSVRAAREVMRSAHEMADAMERVERDELDTQLIVTTASEFAELYEGFNKMAGRLRELIEAREQRAAELTALRAKEHFLALLENASDVITILQADGTISYESPSLERVLGFKPEELVGLNGFDFVHPEDIARVRGSFAQLVEQSRMLDRVEFRFRHRNGSWRILESVGKAVVEPAGQVIFVVNSRDVTERRAAEAALRESEERFRGAFEDAPIGMALQDLEGRYLRVNRSLCAMVGRSEEALLATTERAILYPDDPPQGVVRTQDMVGGLGDFHAPREKRYLHADGHEVWALVSASLVRDSRGSPLYVVVEVQDITERKRAEQALRESEERLRQAQKMEAVGRMAGGIAHNFNNLLTVIIGHCEMALRSLPPGDQVRTRIDRIHQAANRSSELTRQILASSRKQVLSPKRLDLGMAMSEWADLVRPLMGESIELVLIPGQGPHGVDVDPGQLEQVILNLALNARDAMPQGGRLTLQTACVELDEDFVRRHLEVRPGPHVCLAVTDTGVGMDAETKAHLFEPFFTTKGLAERTGLGLATVHGIITQHGGYLDVDSAPGRGTTFRLYLPSAAATAVVVEAPPPPVELAQRSETILLVEDQASLLDLARDILQLDGYFVLEARHPGQALLIGERYAGPIDLLLTDVVMPHMSGRELAERLRAARPALRVLYMSGYPADVTSSHGVPDRGTLFLQKPFSVATLTMKVREALGPPRGGATSLAIV